MKKNFNIWVLLILIMPLTILFCSCGGSKSNLDDKNSKTNNSIVDYTVQFDSNGGSEVKEIKNVKSSSKIEEPPAPTKEGYAFAGWYLGEKKWNFIKDVVTDNITLKAKWNELYTVTFDSDGGSEIASKSVENGNNFQEPPAPTREGYTFDGWYLGEEKWNFIENVVTEDMTLKAKWNEL